MDKDLQDRLIKGSREDSMMRAVVLAVLGRNPTFLRNNFVGKAAITSDGFVMCDFIGSHGEYHYGALVCEVSELKHNIKGIAKFLRLNSGEMDVWYGACSAWIGNDYSGKGLGL